MIQHVEALEPKGQDTTLRSELEVLRKIRVHVVCPRAKDGVAPGVAEARQPGDRVVRRDTRERAGVEPVLGAALISRKIRAGVVDDIRPGVAEAAGARAG